MIRFAIALMVGGGLLMFFGFREYQLTTIADADPQTITAADLIANGPGDNAHVLVTDYGVLLAETIVEYPDNDENKFSKVWAPLVPASDPYLEEVGNLDPFMDQIPYYENSVGLVLYSTDIENQRDLMSMSQSGSVQGLIINKIDKLGGEELAEMQKTLTGINPDTVLVLEMDRKPAGMGKVGGMMGGGLLLLLAGPGLFFMGRR